MKSFAANVGARDLPGDFRHPLGGSWTDEVEQHEPGHCNRCDGAIGKQWNMWGVGIVRGLRRCRIVIRAWDSARLATRQTMGHNQIRPQLRRKVVHLSWCRCSLCLRMHFLLWPRISM